MTNEQEQKIESKAKYLADYLNCNEDELADCLIELIDELLADKRKEVEKLRNWEIPRAEATDIVIDKVLKILE